MNKAFVREPEADGSANCPRCGSLGVAVGKATLDHHLAAAARGKLSDGAWYCGFARCDVAYFDLFERVVDVRGLKTAVYPKDADAPICACFGFTLEDVHTAIDENSPASLRELLAKSKSAAANCSVLAADGQCCMREVQRLYIRGTSGGS